MCSWINIPGHLLNTRIDFDSENYMFGLEEKKSYILFCVCWVLKFFQSRMSFDNDVICNWYFINLWFLLKDIV